VARTSKRNTTIVDIARELGISAMTVSRALNGKGEVSEEMRQRVMDRAQALDYRPNRWARSLVTRRSLMVGVIIPEIAHSFFADVISGIEDVLDKSGYDILLCHSRSNPVREKSEIETLIGSRIDGLIVAPVQPEKCPQPFLEVEKKGIPLVLVDRFFPGQEFSSVRLDDMAAGFTATEFLIQLGHRRIAHISGLGLSNGTLRRKGFLKALRKYGLSDPCKDWIVPAAFDFDGGRKAMEELLSRDLNLTAVFAANDPQAIGAMNACREAGIKVPAGVSIVGAGNIEGLYHPNPFLTTIDWPPQELGRVAARFLLKRIQGEEKKVQTQVFPPKLLVRHSTVPLRP
jgi:DNA-binding LacI/PurR family transcriptional regulator